MQPLVSVCVTTYNHENYIAQALESLLAQRTEFGVEIIIGDDCSKDSTSDICRRYAERYPERVRLLQTQRNMGMRANYRRTIEAARGRYVAMCDGDDYWVDEHKLEQQVKALESNPQAGLCYTRSQRFIEGEGQEWLYPKGPMYCDFENLLYTNTVDNVTAVARRELVLQYYHEVRPEEHPEWLTDDQPMWLWVAARSEVVALERVTAAHRLLKESVSQSRDYLRRIAFCDSLMDISIWMDKRVGKGDHIPRLERKRMEVALWVLSKDGSIGEYIKRWQRDILNSPRLIFNIAGYGLLAKRLLGLQRKKTE